MCNKILKAENSGDNIKFDKKKIMLCTKKIFLKILYTFCFSTGNILVCAVRVWIETVYLLFEKQAWIG